MLSDFGEPLHLKNDMRSGKCLKIILCSGKGVQLIELLKQSFNSCYTKYYAPCVWKSLRKRQIRFSPLSVSLQKSSFRGQARL